MKCQMHVSVLLDVYCTANIYDFMYFLYETVPFRVLLVKVCILDIICVIDLVTLCRTI